MARTLLIEQERSAIDLEKLTKAQATASRLPHAMGGYLLWLGSRMDTLPSSLRELFAEVRSRTGSDKGHLRIPSTLANLWLGLEYALKYAEEIGAITNLTGQHLRSRCWDALLDIGAKQAQAVEADRPSRRFLRVLAALVKQDRALLLKRDCVADGSNGNATIVGWQDEEFLFLIPDAAFQSVARFCRDAGENFPVRSERLWKDLNQEGISECADGRNTATTNLGGQKRRVVKLKRDHVESLIGEAWPWSAYQGTMGTARTAFES